MQEEIFHLSRLIRAAFEHKEVRVNAPDVKTARAIRKRFYRLSSFLTSLDKERFNKLRLSIEGTSVHVHLPRTWIPSISITEKPNEDSEPSSIP